MQLIEFAAALGAEVRGVDLAGGVDGDTASAIHEAWMAHQVLVFRGQALDEQDLIDFSGRFGPLDSAPNGKGGPRFVEGHPELLIISNVRENGEEIGGLGNLEAAWHTDMSYNETPPLGSALYSREIPDRGGETGFLDMYAAHDAMPEALRARVQGLRIKHDATHDSVSRLRRGMTVPTDVSRSPGAVHPIVRTHPQTGRKALFLGRRQFAYVVGQSLEASEALLDELWQHCEDDRFVWYHEWAVGDLVLWDNRCVMHRRNGFDDRQRRVMIRTQIQGDRPF